MKEKHLDTPSKLRSGNPHDCWLFAALLFRSAAIDIEIRHALKPRKPGSRSNRIAPSESHWDNRMIAAFLHA
jgi:hypothetical protein